MDDRRLNLRSAGSFTFAHRHISFTGSIQDASFTVLFYSACKIFVNVLNKVKKRSLPLVMWTEDGKVSHDPPTVRDAAPRESSKIVAARIRKNAR